MVSWCTNLAMVLTTVIFSVESDYDYIFRANGGDVDAGQCIFEGYVSNKIQVLCMQSTITKDFKQDSSLTWEMLTSACPELVYGGCADPSWGTDHSMADELEWSSCYMCPRCPCNQGDAPTYYIHNYTQFTTPFEVKSCYECACEPWFNTGIDNWTHALDCNIEKIFNSPDEFKDVQCPYITPSPTLAPTGGCDGNADIFYPPESYFFYYDENQCETYCYCNATNGRECQTGWANIMADTQLKYPFLETCHDQLFDAYNDTTRWDTPDPSTCLSGMMAPYWRCPTAKCQAGNGTWTALEWSRGVYDADDEFIRAMYDCVECSCPANLVPNCEAYQADVSSEDECIKERLMCSSGTQWGDLDPIQCNAAEGDYCGWREVKAVDGFAPNEVCREDEVEEGPYWSCLPGYICEAFYPPDELKANSSGFCSVQEANYTVSGYDCITSAWVSETYTIDDRLKCCIGNGTDECNNQNIGDSDACSPNSDVTTFMQVVIECQYGNRGINNNDFWNDQECGIGMPEGKYGVCSLLELYWKHETFCDCRKYQVLQNMYPSDEYHNGLRNDLQFAFDAAYASTKDMLEIWNKAYECGKTFECDIMSDWSTSNPTGDPTQPSGNPSAFPSVNPSVNPSYYSIISSTEEVPNSNKDKALRISSSLWSLIAVLSIFDGVILIGCLVYIYLKLLERTKLPGNSSWSQALRQFDKMNYIGVVLELGDLVTDYIFAADLILNGVRTATLGWISLMLSVFGLIMFYTKYILMKKLW
eukprot:1158199_1